MERVLLDANQLKISKPGYSVLSADIRNLSFDSGAQGLGTALIGSASVSGGGPLTIYFPTAFSYIPLVFVACERAGFPGEWIVHGFVNETLIGIYAGAKFTTTTAGITVTVYEPGSSIVVKYAVFYCPA